MLSNSQFSQASVAQSPTGSSQCPGSCACHPSAFAAADVFIQGSAARAFGLEIDWVAMVAGIPVLYFMMMLPSFGNFGTREIVWANVFHGYGDEASLFAFALWTNVVFLVMHVFIGVLFLNRAMSLEP